MLTLGLLLQIHIAFVASKAVTDQQADESQTSSVHVAQQRIGDLGLLGLGHDLHHHHDHEHVHEEHDPGFWKKKVVWKEGWKKGWKAGKKQIWKPDWKKIWKPIWVPTRKFFKLNYFLTESTFLNFRNSRLERHLSACI